MTRKSSYLICGVAFATVMIAALPVAAGIGALAQETPINQVNRAAKGDLLAAPRSIAVKKAPVEMPARRQPAATGQSDKREIMDGCEPAFSAVTVPTMAHVAGRCVG